MFVFTSKGHKHVLFYVIVILQALALTVAVEIDFLPPWAPGPAGNFSQNMNYNIGEKVLFA
jgi:hypothetical protein